MSFTTRPLSGPLTPGVRPFALMRPADRLPSVTFAASAKPNKIDETFIQESRTALEKVFYTNKEEQITGKDLMEALKKFKPFRLLNPVNFLCMGLFPIFTLRLRAGYDFAMGLQTKGVLKHLPLTYSVRTEEEHHCLSNAVYYELSRLHDQGYLDRNGNYDYWLNAKGHLALQLSQQKKCGNSAPAASVSPEESLKTQKQQLEQQKEKISARQTEMANNCTAIRTRLKAETQALSQMNGMLKAMESGSSYSFTSKEERELRCQDRRDDIKNQQALITALNRQLTVAEELHLQFLQESTQAIAKVKAGLTQLEITRLDGETLQMTGQLKEKQAMDEQLALQLAEVQVASATLQKALEAENPEAYVALLRQVRQLEASPQSTDQLTLKVPADQNPLKNIPTTEALCRP